MMATVVPDLALPADETLLSAIRGHHVGRHPITRCAHRLGLTHFHLLDHPGTAAVERERADAIAEIDQWLRARAPIPHPAARPCPEPVGELVDRMAAAQVHAYRLLMTRTGDDPEVHEAWTTLAVLVDTWNEIVDGIDRGIYHLHPAAP